MSRHATRAMFHATALISDYDAAVARLAELIGLRVLEYSDQDDPSIGRRGGMCWIGDGSVELGEPIVDGASPDRFVQRTGGGMQGLALWVEDFAATVEHLAALDTPVPVQMPGGFGFSSPRATCGLQLEWADFTVEEDPRVGAPEPAFEHPPLLDVTHLAFVGAMVDDPIPDAHRLATLFATDVTFERPDAGPTDALAGVTVGDCMLVLYRRLADEQSLAAWGRAFDRPRISSLGVCVADPGSARPALEAAGVRLIDERDGALVLDPRTTADVELVVVDRLFPGDPRT